MVTLSRLGQQYQAQESSAEKAFGFSIEVLLLGELSAVLRSGR